MISAVAVREVTYNSTMISWTTDQLADSVVEYGTTTSFGSILTNSEATTNHMIMMTNLIPATTYYFKVSSKNSYGLSSSSEALAFNTLSHLVTLTINSPRDGSVVLGDALMVRGTVAN